MYCSRVMLSRPDRDYDDIAPLPCRCWDCDYCAPRRRAELVARAAAGRPTRMLTLTVSPSTGTSAGNRYEMLHNAWKILAKRISRKLKVKSIDYCVVVEKTKLGEPHLHILLRCEYIPQRWISDCMKELIGAPIVWISKIDSIKKAVRYVSKYVAKQPGRFGNSRRYWFSRNWSNTSNTVSAKVDERMGTSTIVMQRWTEYAQHQTSQGWVREQIDTLWERWWRPGHRTWAG